MERPATLKEEYYIYIRQRFAQSLDNEMRTLLRRYLYSFDESASFAELEEMVLDQPAAFLYHDYELLTKPRSLEGTFITFDDEQSDERITYYIDQEAAEAIAINQRSAILQRSIDGTRFLVPTERIRNAFQNNCSIDYRERNSNKTSAL